MGRLYKRNVEVIIGPDDGTALSIKDLFIEFEITKRISSKPSEGVVRIYNLSDSSENKIRDIGTRIRFLAGYDGVYDLIYDGDIRKIDKDNPHPDKTTTITLGGNLFKLTDAIFNQSYSGAVPVRQVVEDAVPSFGVDAVGFDRIPDANLNDFSFTGRTSDLLDQILKPLDIQWYEDNGFVKFSNKGQTTGTVFVLRPGSGLVGSPSVTADGVKFVFLLNGKIRPNVPVKIESEKVNGIYKSTQILYAGDNRAGDYFGEGLGVEIEQ